MKHDFATIGLAYLAMMAGCAATPADPLPLKTIADVPMSGGNTRFDYQSLDPAAHRLAIAHMGADRLSVVDTQSNQVVGDVPGISRPTGILVVPSLGRIYASASGANEVWAIDEKSLHVLAKVPTGNFPDGIAFEPGTGHLFVSNESGRGDTVIDTATNQAITTIDLGSEVGNTQYDPGSGLVYANAQTSNQLVAIDPKTNQVTARYDLPGADQNHGLLIDDTHRLAYIACEGNATLLTFDLDAHKVLGSQPVGNDPDVLAFDPGTGLLAVAAESGTVALYQQAGKDLHKLAVGFMADGAHSVAIDPTTHRLYFPLPSVNGQPVLRVMAPTYQPPST